jgi:hypothetical protein
MHPYSATGTAFKRDCFNLFPCAIHNSTFKTKEEEEEERERERERKT